jgi:hypothetical protein
MTTQNIKEGLKRCGKPQKKSTRNPGNKKPFSQTKKHSGKPLQQMRTV